MDRRLKGSDRCAVRPQDGYSMEGPAVRDGLWQWDKLHHKLLEKLHRADRIDWSRAVVDSSSVRSCFRGTSQGPILPTGQRRVVNTM